MAQIIEKKSIIINEPGVFLPLREWEEIQDKLDQHECRVRYEEAIGDSGNQKNTPFEEVKKELNLP